MNSNYSKTNARISFFICCLPLLSYWLAAKDLQLYQKAVCVCVCAQGAVGRLGLCCVMGNIPLPCNRSKNKGHMHCHVNIKLTQQQNAKWCHLENAQPADFKGRPFPCEPKIVQHYVLPGLRGGEGIHHFHWISSRCNPMGTFSYILQDIEQRRQR